MVVLWFSQTRIENKLLILKNQRYRFVDRLISILTVIIIMNEHREETFFFNSTVRKNISIVCK